MNPRRGAARRANRAALAALLIAGQLAMADPAPKGVRPRLAAALAATVRVDATAIRRRLDPRLVGSNLQYTGGGDGVLDPATLALRPALLAKLATLGLGSIRFPGGAHADLYHWRDGVGPQSERRIGEGYFGSGPQTNEYGTDEHLALCAAVGAEATITLNFGTGTPREAANWVEYLNGRIPAAGTEGWTVTSWDGGEEAPAGYFAWLRGQFGHPEPYGVRRFEVGNEVYNDWSSRTDAAGYARRFLEYVAAVKAVDPTVQVAAVGYDRAEAPWNGEREAWNRVVARIAGHAMDAIHVHTYFPLDDGHSVLLASPDPVHWRVELPVTGTWEVRVVAQGRGGFGPYPPADGELAQLAVAVDNHTLGVFPLASPVLARYAVSRRLAAGRHTVSVWAPNAGLDPVTTAGRAVLLDSTIVLKEAETELRLPCTDPSALHPATMAGPVQIGRELATLAEILREETGRDDIEVWVTEANAWFGIFGVRPDVHFQLRAGVAAADLALRAVDAGVSLFQQWSLVDDWTFGLVADPVTEGERPAFHTFRLLTRGLLPLLLPVEVTAPSFDLAAPFGVVEARRGVPYLDALATRDDTTVALLLVNRHPDRPVRADVTLSGWTVGHAKAETVVSAAPDTEDVNPPDAAYRFVPGRVHGAVYLDASRPVLHSTVDRLDAARGTVELWLQPGWDGESAEERAVLSAGWLLHLVKTASGHLSAAVLSEQLDGVSVVFGDIASWRAGDWHHVAVSWEEGGDLVLYLDGEPVATTPLAARWTTVDHAVGLCLGASSVIQGDGLAGAMDEVRVSRRARQPQEIRAAWEAGRAGTPLAADADTTTLLRFDGTIGDAVRDERTHTLRRALRYRADGTVVDLPPTSLTLVTLQGEPLVPRAAGTVVPADSPGVAIAGGALAAPGHTSSAPRSTRLPHSRGSPSTSPSPSPGTKAGSPASTAGEPSPRCGSGRAGSASCGSANRECASCPDAARNASKEPYSSSCQTNVAADGPPAEK